MDSSEKKKKKKFWTKYVNFFAFFSPRRKYAKQKWPMGTRGKGQFSKAVSNYIK